MKKINNSNFELLEDIIKTIDFNYHPNEYQRLEEINKYWEETVGSKISKYSKVYGFSTDNNLTIVCADSFIANELLFNKEKLIERMNKKIKNMGIKIKDIKFDYKKWEEKSNE